MEGAVEDDDARPPGRRARDLDGVLDRLRSRVEKDRLRFGLARPELVEPAAQLHVRLVGADHEALVEVAVDLFVDRRDHGRWAVAEVLAGDSAGEVEELAAVDVPDARALGAGDDERGRRDAAGDVALARCEDPVGGAGSFFHGHRRLDYLRAMRCVQAAAASQCEAIGVRGYEMRGVRRGSSRTCRTAARCRSGSASRRRVPGTPRDARRRTRCRRRPIPSGQ